MALKFVKDGKKHTKSGVIHGFEALKHPPAATSETKLVDFGTAKSNVFVVSPPGAAASANETTQHGIIRRTKHSVRPHRILGRFACRVLSPGFHKPVRPSFSVRGE